MGIYASVAGRYKLGGRIPRRQSFFKSAGELPIPHLHKYLIVSRHTLKKDLQSSLQFFKQLYVDKKYL
jgi:hypothetical protein